MADANQEIEAMKQIRLAILQNSLNKEETLRVLLWAIGAFTGHSSREIEKPVDTNADSN